MNESKIIRMLYATYSGGYDEGGLHYGKAVSEQKYGKALEMWNGYKPKTYLYRVDLSCDGDNLTYYLGPADIKIDNDTRVISFNDRAFGAKLANYRTGRNQACMTLIITTK